MASWQALLPAIRLVRKDIIKLFNDSIVVYVLAPMYVAKYLDFEVL